MDLSGLEEKEAATSPPLCFALSVKEFQKLQVVLLTSLFPSQLLARGRAGGWL